MNNSTSQEAENASIATTSIDSSTNASIDSSLNTTMNETMNQTINSTLQNVSQVDPTFIIFQTPFSTSPLIDILIISIIAALFTTLLNKYLTDQVAIKALRKEMKEKQKNMREMMKTDPKKAQAMQGDIMKKNMEVFKHSFNIKIMVITLLPLLYIFTEIRAGYMHYDTILNLGFVSFGWLGSYIILTIVASLIIKKALKVA